jgi:hypothetical protein
MSHYGDHDGKSKTSSAVDEEHYPDGDSEQHSNTPRGPAQKEIAQLAYQLWEERGRLDNSHEQDWFEAERRLTEESETPQDLRIMQAQQGSVQS